MAVRRGWWPLAAGLLAAAALCLELAQAAGAGLAQVGPRSIDVNSLLARAARLAPFQLARFGASWSEQRRQILDRELVREALLEAEAARDDRRLSSARDSVLARALLDDLAQQVKTAGVTEAQIGEYYAEHRQSFEAPRALLLWRILLRQEADARAVLRELSTPNEATWNRLARERSTDTATHMRSGSLGFVAADGQTHMPQLRVSPLLFAAADRVGDGQIVPEPVAEGAAYAVIWRRASRAAQPNQLAAVSADIAALLMEGKLTDEAHALTERLRKEGLRDHQPTLLSGFEPRALDTLEPGKLPSRGLALRPVTLNPRTTDSGLR